MLANNALLNMTQRGVNVASICKHLNRVSEHCQLLSNITSLHEACLEFESFYAEYDYDGKTQANGFRSFVKIVNGLLARIA